MKTKEQWGLIESAEFKVCALHTVDFGLITFGNDSGMTPKHQGCPEIKANKQKLNIMKKHRPSPLININ